MRRAGIWKLDLHREEAAQEEGEMVVEEKGGRGPERVYLSLASAGAPGGASQRSHVSPLMLQAPVLRDPSLSKSSASASATDAGSRGCRRLLVLFLTTV